MSTKSNLLASATLSLFLSGSLFLCGPASAASTDGWYASLEGGAVWVQAWDHIRTSAERCYTVTRPATAEFDTGWAGLGSIGYGMNHWRVEIEGGYRQNNLGSYIKNGWVLSDTSGDLTEITAMLNVLYDVPLTDAMSLSIGAGVGGDYAEFSFDLPWSDINHNDWRFAYQGIAGLNYALTTNLAMYINYRYLNAQGPKFDADPWLSIDGEDLHKHTATLGLRYAFSSPAAAPLAPPPPPQPAAPVEREFLIFFGFNKSNLTRQAMDTVRQAATAAQQLGTAKIRVVGHTDRSGSLSYNKALSMRRADTVKKALVSEGVMGSAISIAGRGESDPLVQTADGVREPQNRRVQIGF